MIEGTVFFKSILEELKQELSDKNEISNEYTEKSNQNEVKDIIAEYKKNIDLLDDCIFVEVIDDLTSYNVNFKQFDDLLNKEDLSESEETYICYLIGFTNTLIRQHIYKKVKDLVELLDKF